MGTPGSPGRARGIWTPLFNIAAAAVTEVGGPFSRAAIVAREFGIPLVNGAVDATRDIADGTFSVVDGSTKIIELPSHDCISVDDGVGEQLAARLRSSGIPVTDTHVHLA